MRNVAKIRPWQRPQRRIQKVWTGMSTNGSYNIWFWQSYQSILSTRGSRTTHIDRTSNRTSIASIGTQTGLSHYPCPQLIYASGRKLTTLVTEPVTSTIIPLCNNRLSSFVALTMKLPSDSEGRQLIKPQFFLITATHVNLSLIQHSKHRWPSCWHDLYPVDCTSHPRIRPTISVAKYNQRPSSPSSSSSSTLGPYNVANFLTYTI